MAHQYAVSILSGLIGGSGVVALFGKRWVDGFLEKTKAGYSRELAELQAQYAQQLEAIRGEIGRAVFVSNVHFETEFDALKRTFEAATRLRQLFMGLRPFVDRLPKDDVEKERVLAQRLSKTIHAYNAFLSTYEELSPFYPKEIHAKFDDCAKAAHLEVRQTQMASGERLFAPDWYLQAFKNQEEFGDAYLAASELIRDRISRLAVTGRTPRR